MISYFYYRTSLNTLKIIELSNCFTDILIILNTGEKILTIIHVVAKDYIDIPF